MRGLRAIAVLPVMLAFTVFAAAEFRFPMPEFETAYQRPETHAPGAVVIPPAVDVAVLAGTLALAAWVVVRRRSRREVVLLAVFSTAWFGFYRQGCVCPVGSVQNVLNAFVGNHAAVTPLVLAFFLLPLVFALWFGRVFCAAVCPLGAVQELCAVRPVRLPGAVDTVLGLFAYAYLGLAVVGVVTGAGFLVCRFDPFVGFFRMSGSFNMLLAGGILLALGTVVARPYCRFLCPYGVLLRWASMFSRWHASITPAACVQCRLCENACPYNAINTPTPEGDPEPRSKGIRRLALLLALSPAVIALGALAGYALHEPLAKLHPLVALAETVAAGERGVPSVEYDAFKDGSIPAEKLYADAEDARRSFARASAWFGAFMGLALCGRLLRLSVIRRSKDYETDRGACVSCARCFAYCPVEREDAAN